MLILILITSFAEVLSIGSVFPFLGAIATPTYIFELPVAQPVIKFFGLSEPKQFLLPITLIFVIAVLLASSLRLLLLWANTRLAFAIGADLSVSVYRRTLYQPYAVHCARNSSEIISGVTNKTAGMISIITHLLSIVSGMIILAVILLVLLLSVNPAIVLLAFGGFGFIYLAIVRLTRAHLIVGSSIIANESTQVIKSLQEGLGGIRDVLIDGTQDVFCEVYRKADLALRKAQAVSHFIQSSPRFAVEGLAIILISILAYFLVHKSNDYSKALPVLGVLALGAQRLLPLLQQAYGSWTAIQSGKISLRDGLDLLDQPLPDYQSRLPEPIVFEHQIKLAQISFRYDVTGPFILNNVSFVISKGDRVGFIGETGSGKSTTLDIVMGLLEPIGGALMVDEKIIDNLNRRSWQARISHVPQVIFLSDTTIEENIAFGVPRSEIDSVRVCQVALQAQLHDTIISWPRGYKTLVGERGVRLSGGQRQRIGIARALYKRADVIIFDEATSALDVETEQAVMQSIEGLSRDITLLIIAHRHTTLKNCTKIIELGFGQVKKIGSYQDIISSKFVYP